MTFPSTDRIGDAIHQALATGSRPVRIWLSAGEYAALNADAYRQSGGAVNRVTKIEDAPISTNNPAWGQPSRVVMGDGRIFKITS